MLLQDRLLIILILRSLKFIVKFCVWLALPLDMISLYLIILTFVITLMMIQRPVSFGSFVAF